MTAKGAEAAVEHHLTVDDIEVVDFAAEDIPGMLDYWYRSPRDFLLGMGVSPDELPSEKLMREMLEINVEKNRQAAASAQAILSIKVCGDTIGVHELTHLALPTSAIMHAHIWSNAYRGKGVGLVSYVKAMGIFFARFGLEQIVFETPAENRSARRVKERLGIMPEGRGTITWPIVRRSIETVTYRVRPAEMPAIERAMQAEWQRRWPSPGTRADGR